MVSTVIKHTFPKSKILAYMDDVALLSHNIESLQEATNIFCSFLTLNSIKCNKKKTDLITNLKTRNPLRQQVLLVENEPIQPKPYNEAIKYLGVYISGKSSSISSKRKLKDKIINFTNAIATQKGWNGSITKQASHWIIPAQLDYATHATILSDNEINLLQSKMNKAIKNKLGVDRTISNKVLHSQAGLHIIKLQNRRDLTAIKLLTTKLINTKIQPYIKKEIESLQASYTIWSCPICNPYYFKETWLILTAQLAKKYRINICPIPCPFEIHNYENSIGLITKINKPTALSLYYTNLKIAQNVFVFNSHIKLNWEELHTHRGYIPTGPIPIWFKNITNSHNLIIGDSLSVSNNKNQFWAFLNNNIIKCDKMPIQHHKLQATLSTNKK